MVADVSAEPRPVWVGTSWKMTKTLAESVEFVTALAEGLGEAGVPAGVRAFVLPPHTALATVRDALPGGLDVTLGAQDAHWEPEGAVTGAVSMRQVRDAGAELVEIGHSERRARFGDTDEVVARKVEAALAADLVPLLCVGEGAELRGRAERVAHVAHQVRSALSRVRRPAARQLLVAYEPVWAIGDAGEPARPDEVAPVVEAIRRALADLDAAPAGNAAPVLYGGSVTAANAPDLLDTGVDGLFVGRAAWRAPDLVRLIRLIRSVADRRLQEAS